MKQPGTPVPGKRYDVYNDGKCRPSRHASVVIDRIAGLQELNLGQLNDWKTALEDDFDGRVDGCIRYPWTPNQFWDWNCDEFAVGRFVGDDYGGKSIFFARHPDGSWYGVDWNYMLDVTGSVRRKYLHMWRQAAAECGQTMKWNRKAGRFEYFDTKTGEKKEES